MNPIVGVINLAFQVYTWILFIRILLSWIKHDPYHPIIRFIYEITEPLLSIFRRVIPPIGGMIDISPIAAFFVIELVRRFLIGILYSMPW